MLSADYDKFRKFEEAYIASTPPNFEANLRLQDAMYEQARAMGHFTEKDIWLGFEATLAVAQAINHKGLKPAELKNYEK